MVLKLKRGKETSESTPGTLTVNDFVFHTIERLSTGDHPRIPAGAYALEQFHSPHNGDCLQVKDVPGRSMIEIHSANYASELRGCVAVGMTAGDDCVWNSKEALKALLLVVKPAFAVGDEVKLVVEE